MKNNSDKKLIPPDDVMDYKGLSAYLKLSAGFLRHLVMRNQIPFSKIGTSVRFSKKQIDSWFDKKKCGSDPRYKFSENPKENKNQSDLENELFIDDEAVNND